MTGGSRQARGQTERPTESRPSCGVGPQNEILTYSCARLNSEQAQVKEFAPDAGRSGPVGPVVTRLDAGDVVAASVVRGAGG